MIRTLVVYVYHVGGKFSSIFLNHILVYVVSKINFQPAYSCIGCYSRYLYCVIVVVTPNHVHLEHLYTSNDYTVKINIIL